jgi:hypothetical protein
MRVERMALHDGPFAPAEGRQSAELRPGRIVLSVRFGKRCSRRGYKMQRHDVLTRRIEDLAVFLDPVAFEHRQDLALAKRREAAWREATNRITCSRTAT